MTQGRRTGVQDVLLGKKVKEARNLRKCTQTQLAEKLGLSCQQIQKYEKGSNRISSISLFQIAKILNLPIEFFYQDIANANNAKYKNLTPQMIHLLDIYSQLPARKQSALLQVMKSMLEEE